MSVKLADGMGATQELRRASTSLGGRLGRIHTGAGAARTIGGIERARIVIVCTANACRSPMAAGLLRHHLLARGADVEVSSAGVLDGTRGATDLAVATLAERGVTLAGHRSRTLAEAADDLDAADLVVGMERRHVQEVVLEGFPVQRAFTFVDLVRRAEAAEARRPDESLAAWAERLAAGRRRDALMGIGDDAVADPVGQGPAAYRATADLLEQLVTRFIDRAFPAAAGAARSA